MDLMALFSTIGTVVGASAACAAVYYAKQIANKQIEVQKSIHQESKDLSKRQLIVPIWDYCKSLSFINPSEPIGPDIAKSLNALELLGVCREGGMVDAEVIDLVFKEIVLEIGKQVLAVKNVPGYEKSGEEMFEGSKVAYRMFLEFKQAKIDEGKLKKA